MKKIKTITLSILTLLVPLVAMAEPTVGEITGLTIPEISVIALVGTLLNWFFFALLVVAIFLLVNVGYQFVVSGGDSKKTSTAGKNLGFILIGIAVALIAKGLVFLTCNIVAGDEIKCSFF